jgi:hypothetical protein
MREDTKPEPELMTRPEAAEFLRITKGTLEKWAARGIGPPYILVGRNAIYRKRDLLNWIDDKARRHVETQP